MFPTVLYLPFLVLAAALFLTLSDAHTFTLELPEITSVFFPNITSNRTCPKTYTDYYSGEYHTHKTTTTECPDQWFTDRNPYYYTDDCRVSYCNSWKLSAYSEYERGPKTSITTEFGIADFLLGTGSLSNIITSIAFKTVTTTSMPP